MGSGRGLTPLDLGATLVVAAARLALGVVVALGLLAVGPALVGLPTTVVLSDSMAPGIRAGDVVVLAAGAPSDLRGRVVLADDPDRPGRLRLHRVVREDHGRLVLRGDANPAPDPTPVDRSAVHGTGFLRVPAIGLPTLWARQGALLPLLLAAAALIGTAALIAALDPDAGRWVRLGGRRVASVVQDGVGGAGRERSIGRAGPT